MSQNMCKFQLFFLNLSSKFPAGVSVRMSKYPYMDSCVQEYEETVAKQMRVWAD